MTSTISRLPKDYNEDEALRKAMEASLETTPAKKTKETPSKPLDEEAQIQAAIKASLEETSSSSSSTSSKKETQVQAAAKTEDVSKKEVQKKEVEKAAEKPEVKPTPKKAMKPLVPTQGEAWVKTEIPFFTKVALAAFKGTELESIVKKSTKDKQPISEET